MRNLRWMKSADPHNRSEICSIFKEEIVSAQHQLFHKVQRREWTSPSTLRCGHTSAATPRWGLYENPRGKSTFRTTGDLHFIPRTSTERQIWQWCAVIPVLYREMDVEMGDSPRSWGPASPEYSAQWQKQRRDHASKQGGKGKQAAEGCPPPFRMCFVTLVPARMCAHVHTLTQFIKKTRQK